MTDFFLDSQSPVSDRHAELADDGTSAWLYLTEPESREVVADVWVHNRIAAPPTSEIKNYRGGPPPAAAGFAAAAAICDRPEDSQWRFIWSPDGEAVAIVKGGQPVAFVIAGGKYGCSRDLIKDGPWGSVWDAELFDRTFPSDR